MRSCRWPWPGSVLRPALRPRFLQTGARYRRRGGSTCHCAEPSSRRARRFRRSRATKGMERCAPGGRRGWPASRWQRSGGATRVASNPVDAAPSNLRRVKSLGMWHLLHLRLRMLQSVPAKMLACASGETPQASSILWYRSSSRSNSSNSPSEHVGAEDDFLEGAGTAFGRVRARDARPPEDRFEERVVFLLLDQRRAGEVPVQIRIPARDLSRPGVVRIPKVRADDGDLRIPPRDIVQGSRRACGRMLTSDGISGEVRFTMPV